MVGVYAFRIELVVGGMLKPLVHVAPGNALGTYKLGQTVFQFDGIYHPTWVEYAIVTGLFAFLALMISRRLPLAAAGRARGQREHRLDVRAAGFAPAARLLASWWSAADGGRGRPLGRGLGRGGRDRRSARVSSASVDVLRGAAEEVEPDALREEYERLLVGPGRVPCAPYESLWRGDQPRREQGRLMAACAAEVARLYADIGLRVRPDAHELPDHLVVEWEALAYAFEHEAADAAALLVRDHLAGMDAGILRGGRRGDGAALLRGARAADARLDDRARIMTLVLDAGLRPEEAAAALRNAGATRVVLTIGERPASAELLAALRRAGAEPFGIETVAVGGRALEESAVLVAAACAKLDALSPDERGRPRLNGGAVSRRSLFSPGAMLTQAPVAVLDEGSCVASARCGLCVERCPEDAIAASSPRPSDRPARMQRLRAVRAELPERRTSARRLGDGPDGGAARRARAGSRGIVLALQCGDRDCAAPAGGSSSFRRSRS